jgi:seryl-tRNA synthetase
MDTSITISAIVAIIACCSLWVAYKVYLYTTASRKADKLLELRMQVVDLRAATQKLKYSSQSLSKSHPTKHDQDANDKLGSMINYIEEIHQKLYGDPSSLAEKDIDDMTISILNSRNEMECEFERIKKISKT